MSGIEVVGVLLGVFPLIISGLDSWRDIAKIGGFYWRIRKEYSKCLRDVQYHQLLYKRNLHELLLPILNNDADEVARLVGEPGGKDWSSKALGERLEGRLQESYLLYMEIIHQMNETAEELRKELSLDKVTVQNKLASPGSSPQQASKSSKLASAKSKWDYETFRLKFSFNEPVREKLFNQLAECNTRLTKLLSSSDKISELQNTTPAHAKRTSVLETVFKKAWKKSDLLFKALQKAWQCSCQEYHFANLRLEHRTLPEICFEVIFTFVAPSSQANAAWSWRELQCGQMITCSSQHALANSVATQPRQSSPAPASAASGKRKTVAFSTPAPVVPKIEFDVSAEACIRLCQLLGVGNGGQCMGIIGHEDEMYHLHPLSKRKQPNKNDPLTLDYILSTNFKGHLSRRQRYSMALLLASSVAQLQFTPWLRTGLTKGDVLLFPCENDNCDIPYCEPFICQGFPVNSPAVSEVDCNFHSLGILLLELCFGQRLEDQPFRQQHPAGVGEVKQALDLKAALKWSQIVEDEGGEDYASAVRWCFTGATNASKSWRNEIIRNVIRPLEICQEHFKATATVT